MLFTVKYEAKKDKASERFFPKTRNVEAESEGEAIKAVEKMLLAEGYDVRFVLYVGLATTTLPA